MDDKKSNRTDLLAAGRKKLQQYRQKKDSKGKDGKGKDAKTSKKSTSKADNLEQNNADANVVSAADMKKAESSQVPGIEVKSLAVDTEKPLENSEGPSSDSQNSVDPPGFDHVSAETTLNHEPDSNTPIDGGEFEIVVREVEGPGTSGSTESNTVHVDLASSSDYIPKAAADAEKVAAVSVESQSLLEGDQGQCRRFTVWVRSILIEVLSWSWKEMKFHQCPTPSARSWFLHILWWILVFLPLQSVGSLEIMIQLRLMFLLRQPLWVLK